MNTSTAASPYVIGNQDRHFIIMGAWGTDIKENDTSADIYADFFDLYNSGQKPPDISEKIILENQELINNIDDSNNFWFALALAQWETKSLDTKVFEKVRDIIESEIDLQIWRDLDADETDIKKRKSHLENFLSKLQTNRNKAKPKKKPRNVKPIFTIGECLTFRFNNGNYGGAVILAVNDDPELGYNLVAGTRINQPNKPTSKDFEEAEILIKNFGVWKDDVEVVWINPEHYEKEYSSIFEIIGKLEVEIEYNTEGKFKSYCADWSHAIHSAEMQFEHEKTNTKPAITITVTELTKHKKWWKLW